jgi:hypothetical protein
MSLPTKLYGTVVLTVFLVFMNSCQVFNKWETTNAVILEVREPVKDSVLQMVVYGYYAGLYALVDSTRIAYDSVTVAGDCMEIKYHKNDFLKVKVESEPYDCKAIDYLIVHGNINNAGDSPIYIQRATVTDTSLSVFITDAYFQLVPMVEQVDLLFEVEGKRSKLLRLDLGTGEMPEYHALNMEPTFVDGSGVDTTHTHYSDVDDVWYFVPREK